MLLHLVNKKHTLVNIIHFCVQKTIFTTLNIILTLFLGDTFTYDDINRNTLQYVHDGSATTEDSMEIAVTDGVTSTTTLVKIVVSLANDNGPRLVPGCLLSITAPSKSSAIITRTNLAYMVSSLSLFCFYKHFGQDYKVIAGNCYSETKSLLC